MVGALNQTPYSIAYIGISYKEAIDQDKLGEAELENKSGKFVLPEDNTVQAAASAMGDKTPADESVSLIFEPGDDSYPIVNYEYAIVNSKMGEPQAKEVRDFLSWGINPDKGSSGEYLNKVHFIALPASVRALSEKQIGEIGHS